MPDYCDPAIHSMTATAASETPAVCKAAGWEEIASDYKTLREEAGVVIGERDVLKASGPDAQSYLDGQLSQDIAAMGMGKSSADRPATGTTGKSAWSFILQPTGKVDAYCRVFRSNEKELYLEVPAGCGEAVLSRLQRFKLRVDCELELMRWQMWAIRGFKSGDIDIEAIVSQASSQLALVASVNWQGIEGFDLLGTALPTPPVRECSPAALDALRIEAGVPEMSQDIMEGAIPAEAGNRILDEAVSFTKGCYVGQELVARVESRGGNVPRRLLGVMLEDAEESSASLKAGELLYQESDTARQVGTLTSVALSPRLGLIGLALIHRSVDPPASLVCGNRYAKVVDLPFPNEERR